MKVTAECYQCLRRLTYQAAELATDNPALRQKAICQGLKLIDDNFSSDKLSITIATHIHRQIKEITQNSDPYRKMKDEEIKMSWEISREVGSRWGHDPRSLLLFSLLGNAIDFFRDFGTIKKDMTQPVKLAIDDVDEFEKLVANSETILYLADNAGEIPFDLPLIRWMEGFASVTYAVKQAPVQNDLTAEDLRRWGLAGEFRKVITTGSDTPGVDLSLASAKFMDQFESADLILAKGMGYYESLSELPAEGRIFYCLMAKCNPVARSLGVPLNGYVAMLR